jgi:hypothetical protein
MKRRRIYFANSIQCNPLKHLAAFKENWSFCCALAVKLQSAEMAEFSTLHPAQQTLSFGCDHAIPF